MEVTEAAVSDGTRKYQQVPHVSTSGHKSVSAGYSPQALMTNAAFSASVFRLLVPPPCYKSVFRFRLPFPSPFCTLSAVVSLHIFFP